MIEVPTDFLMRHYLNELSQMTQRALHAETQVAVLQQRLTMQAMTLEHIANARSTAPETA